jgi:hypothetical protein
MQRNDPGRSSKSATGTMRAFIAVGAIAGSMSAMGLNPRAVKWPVIVPVHASVTFGDPGKNDTDTPFSTLVNDQGGRPAYKVACHNGYYDSKNSKINYSSDFQCALLSQGADTLEETDFNLLVSPTKLEESSDDNNRGVMTAAQLAGRCADYPEYGAVRNFRLRGMVVTFKFTNLAWASASQGVARLSAFTFGLSVVPDSSAHTARAEVVHVAKPPRSCNPLG